MKAVTTGLGQQVSGVNFCSANQQRERDVAFHVVCTMLYIQISHLLVKLGTVYDFRRDPIFK